MPLQISLPTAVLPSFQFSLLSLAKLKSHFSSFTMLPRALTYSPVQEIDKDDSATEKLLGHWLDHRENHKISRYRSFLNHYWVYFTHGALLLLIILFFCLWMRDRVQKKIPKIAVYCKSYLFKSKSRLPEIFLQLLPMSPWNIIKSSQFLMELSTILLSIVDIPIQKLMLLGAGYLTMARTALVLIVNTFD